MNFFVIQISKLEIEIIFWKVFEYVKHFSYKKKLFSTNNPYQTTNMDLQFFKKKGVKIDDDSERMEKS